ncbi:MAG: DNA polymerase IV [bacterium]
MVAQRTIMHVDMDAFFARVEKIDNPEIADKPVIVGGLSDRGVVSTACYQAREYGIGSAMPMTEARRLCPEGEFLPVRGERYRQVSEKIFDILRSYTPKVETVSLDEAFMDISGVLGRYDSPRQPGGEIKNEIRNQTGLTCSVGIGPNKMIAKLASEENKPDGLLEVKEEEKGDFLEDIDIRSMWGVGKKTYQKIKQFEIETIGDLQECPLPELREELGDRAYVLKKRARGEDDSPVVTESETKSVSNETTFSEDLTDSKVLKKKLFQLTEKVSRRLREKELEGRTVTVKIRRGDYTTFTRSHTIKRPTSVTEKIWKVVNFLFDTEYEPDSRGVRLLGVGVENLQEKGQQEELFVDPEEENQKELNRLIDDLNSEYGDGTIKRGRHL